MFFVLTIWQFNAFCIPASFYGDYYKILALAFIVFTALCFNMFIKLSCLIGIFIHFSINVCVKFLRFIFRIFYFFMFGCLFFLLFALIMCVFVNFLHISYLFTSFNNCNSSSCSAFVHIHVNIGEVFNCLQDNNNSYSKDL